MERIVLKSRRGLVSRVPGLVSMIPAPSCRTVILKLLFLQRSEYDGDFLLFLLLSFYFFCYVSLYFVLFLCISFLSGNVVPITPSFKRAVLVIK